MVEGKVNQQYGLAKWIVIGCAFEWFELQRGHSVLGIVVAVG